MLRSESQKLPALERCSKGEALMLCSVPTPSILINKRQTKVANFWRSPYNEVFRIAKTAAPSKSTLPDVASASPWQRSSPPAPPTPLPLPLPLSHTMGEKSSTPTIRSGAEERENKGDNPMQIRGILSRPGGENGSDGGKKKAARRVQFADRYEKLCELGKKYGGRAPKAEPASEACQSELVDVILPCTREGLDALQGGMGREKTDLQDEDGTSDDFHCLSRSSSLPDLVSAPLSGSMSPFKLSPLSNETESAQARLAKVESPLKSPRVDSPLRIIRNPYSRHTLFPSRLIRAKTSMTSKKPYVVYGFDLSGEDNERPPGKSTSLSTSLQRAKTFLSVKGRSGMKAGGSIPRRPLASLCDASKTLQIIQWLRDVNVTQAKEGKCTASLAPASPYEHTS